MSGVVDYKSSHHETKTKINNSNNIYPNDKDKMDDCEVKLKR